LNHKLRYVVGVTFPDQATADRWLEWLRAGHVADVLAGGATFAQIMHHDGDAVVYEVTYSFPSREALDRYERDFAPRLREEGRRLFPPEQGIVYHRTVATILDEFSKDRHAG